MHKGQERENVKACYEFDNDLVKYVLKLKTKIKVVHRIKYIQTIYLLCRL